MAAFLDNCRFNPTLGGTTDWTYSSAVAGYQSPAAAGAVNGTKYKYFAIDGSNNWELGEGAYNTTGPVLPRTTITANSLGTTAKINFAAAPQVAIVAIKGDLISIEEANSFTAGQKAQARTNIAAVLKGQIFGLTLSTAGASATFGIAVGEAADSTGVDLMALASAYTKTTSAWALGTAAGSLDTGAVAASSWYHAFLIKRPDTGVVDVLTSLSATAPTLPTNYTLFRRIGSMKTNGSAQWLKFIQDGDLFTWDAPVQDVNVTNPGTAAVTRTISTPLGVRVQANIFAIGEGSTSGNSPGGVNISDLSVADNAASTTNGSIYSYVATGGDAVLGALVSVMTNTSSQVRSRVQISTASTNLFMSAIGWSDTRGRIA